MNIYTTHSLINSKIAGGPAGASEANMEEYMEKLQSFVLEGKNNPLLKQARDILNRVELPSI